MAPLHSRRPPPFGVRSARDRARCPREPSRNVPPTDCPVDGRKDSDVSICRIGGTRVSGAPARPEVRVVLTGSGLRRWTGSRGRGGPVGSRPGGGCRLFLGASAPPQSGGGPPRTVSGKRYRRSSLSGREGSGPKGIRGAVNITGVNAGDWAPTGQALRGRLVSVSRRPVGRLVARAHRRSRKAGKPRSRTAASANKPVGHGSRRGDFASRATTLKKKKKSR